MTSALASAPTAAAVTPRMGDDVMTPDGVGVFYGVTSHLYAVIFPDGVLSLGMAPGSVLGYMPADVTPAPAAPAPVAPAPRPTPTAHAVRRSCGY